MVVIRLARAGTRNRPFYHVVATDRRDPRDGRHLERLGYFNPRFSGQAKRIELNLNRVDYWLSVGAQPSPRVTSLLKELKKAAATATPPIEQITQPEPEAASATPEQPAAKSKPKKTLTRKKAEKPEKTEE